MRRFIRVLMGATYRPLAAWYLRRDRYYSFAGFRVLVRKGVFHPGLFFSTKSLIRDIDCLDLSGKSVLELGAGSGLISMIAARRGAVVTATDISRSAVANIRQNAASNGLDIEVVRSDLFDDLDDRRFDFVFINPPYYPGAPARESDYAWYCGENLDYFRKLFRQLPDHIAVEGLVRMILSDDCQIDAIRGLAASHEMHLGLVREDRLLTEVNYVFDLYRS